MTVWSAADVDAAVESGATTLHVAARDVVTPLARERARERNVHIETATPATQPPGVHERGSRAPGRGRGSGPTGAGSTGATPGKPTRGTGERTPRAAGVDERSARAGGGARAGRGSGDGGAPPEMRPPSGALFRRGAPLPAGLRSGNGARGRRGRVVVVGAGHVGMIAAMRLADADVFDEVVLTDIDAGRAAGIALDLTHTAALSGFATRVRGVGTVEDAGTCDYAVITAGRPRTPGMSRSDLISTNAEIVGDVAARLAHTSPHVVLVVVTNPLDEMTQHAWQASGLPPRRVIGMAGVLDTARFQALASLTGAARADRIEGYALGSHGEEMVVPQSTATVDGRPLTDLIDRGELDSIVDRTRGSGAEVVGLLQSGSAFMAPGMSAARMVLAMAADSGETMPAAVLAEGQYGIRDVYVGLPVTLGRDGVREIVELPLRPDELTALRTAADRIRERLAALAG